MNYEYIVFAAAFIQLIGIYSYIRDTIKGIVKPNRVTWLMWSIAPLIATFAALSDGVSWTTLPVFMSGFAPLLVFLASFINKQSYWKLYKFDYICGVLSLLALILWFITNDPRVAILFAILSDGVAALPTIIKAWKNPETESVWPYATGIINASSGFFVLQSSNFSEIAFIIYLLFVNTALIISTMKNKLIAMVRP